jgi:hypothetical protein
MAVDARQTNPLLAPNLNAQTDNRILAVLDRPVPAGHGRWTGLLIAAAT